MRKLGGVAFRTLVALGLEALSGCGTVPPPMTEVWEEREIDSDLAYRIKRSIFCEAVQAIRNVNRSWKERNHNDFDVIPLEYGMQFQTTLTVEESTSINTGLTLNRVFTDDLTKGVKTGQSSTFGLGATVSTSATRIDTSYSYYVVGKIAGPGKNKDFCFNEKYPIDRHGTSLLLQSDLGIERYLMNNVKAADAIPSSVPASDKKDAKLDIFSYDLKFVVISNGNFSPVWKLVGVSANTGAMPFLSSGRTRTHELLLTFGPNSAKGFDIALQAHFNSQIVNRTPLSGGL